MIKEIPRQPEMAVHVSLFMLKASCLCQLLMISGTQ